LIPELRTQFNRSYVSDNYARLLALLEQRCGVQVEFRVAETPVFVPLSLLQQMSAAGAELAHLLISDPDYLQAARKAIPPDYFVAGETAHPHFLTADFALVRSAGGELEPKLVEIQAFPSVFGYQSVLSATYREVFGLQNGLGSFLGGLTEDSYWELLGRTILGDHDPEYVVLAEVDPHHQKTRPDFEVDRAQVGHCHRRYHYP
jgi:hypothetical protein